MRSIIFGYLAVISLVLTIMILTKVQPGFIANLLTPVFASSNITELFTAKLFGDMEVLPIETNATEVGRAIQF